MTKAKWALVASLFALIGMPLIFLGISIYTGITGLVTSLVQIQLEKK